MSFAPEKDGIGTEHRANYLPPSPYMAAPGPSQRPDRKSRGGGHIGGGVDGGIRMFPLLITDLLTFGFLPRRRELIWEVFFLGRRSHVTNTWGQGEGGSSNATKFPLKFFPAGSCWQF